MTILDIYHPAALNLLVKGLTRLREQARRAEQAYDKRNREGRRIAALARFHQDPERFRENNRRWKKLNPERAAENHRLWVARNPERARAHSHASRLRHPEEVKAAGKAYRVRNRRKLGAKKNLYNKHRRTVDPIFRLRLVLRSRAYSALNGASKAGHTVELLGTTLPEFKAHLENRFLSGMTWENHGTVWHIDHIKPCATFDLTDPAQQRACFHYSNQQPLFVGDNLKKGAKWKEAA